MLGFTPKSIKEIHKQLVTDIQEIYEHEISLLEHERKTIDILKKYEKKIIVKHIFQKAKWKKDVEWVTPGNTYAKIIYNFDELINRLHYNISGQQGFLRKKLIKINEGYEKEMKDKADLPLFKKIIKKTDKKALYTLKRLNHLLLEIIEYFFELSKGFFKGNRMAEIYSFNPQKFHEIFKKICESIDHKNKTLETLHKVMKYETDLQKQLHVDHGKFHILERIKK